MIERLPHRHRLSVGALIGLLVVGSCWKDSSLSAPSKQWVIVAIVLVAAVVFDALPDLRCLLAGPGVLTLAMFLPLAAIYGCVPETDHIADVGLVIAAVAAIELVTWRTMSLGWHAVAMSLVLWAGVFGAAGHDRAFVGGLFAFWPLILTMAVARLLPRAQRAGSTVGVIVLGLGTAASLVVSRTGALRPGRREVLEDAARAALGSAVLAFAVAGLATLATRARRRR